LLAAVSAACDAGKQHDQRTIGPLVRVLGTNVDGAGSIPADGVLQISFDRYLLPSTITRQSYLIVDSSNKPITGTPFATSYDPVARTVTITGPEGPGRPWLTPDQSYKLFLPVAPDPNTDVGGFRAIDRAPLFEGSNREIVFRASAPAQKTSFEPNVDFCADVFPIFAIKCGGSLCHGAYDTAAASLILGSHNGIRLTAISRVAQGSNTTARSYNTLETQPVFGQGMAIIKPGDPGSSWLMYKIELARLPTVDAAAPNQPPQATLCTPPETAPSIPAPAGVFAPLAPAQIEADEIERGVLSDFVLGREMPYPVFGAVEYATEPLTFQERERIRIWIARGAETRDCGGCQRVDADR